MRGQQKGANGLTHHIIFTLKLHSGLEIRFVFDIISYNPQCLHTIVGPRSQHIFIYVHTIVWIRPSSVFCRSDIKICPEKVYAHVNGQQFPQLMHILEFEYKFSQYDLYTILDFTLSYYWIIALLAATILQSTMIMLFSFYFWPLISAENIKELGIYFHLKLNSE